MRSTCLYRRATDLSKGKSIEICELKSSLVFIRRAQRLRYGMAASSHREKRIITMDVWMLVSGMLTILVVVFIVNDVWAE